MKHFSVVSGVEDMSGKRRKFYQIILKFFNFPNFPETFKFLMKKNYLKFLKNNLIFIFQKILFNLNFKKYLQFSFVLRLFLEFLNFMS